MQLSRNWQLSCACWCVLLIGAGLGVAAASEWAHWRGPAQTGASSETGLVSEWSIDGKNLAWKADFIGRSTPVVLDGRVYVIGRVGKDITEQERVACFDAKTGDLLWEHRWNLFHTTIPFNRVGWASLTGDTETGNVYAHGVGGMFVCFSKHGDVLWSHSLTEEFGRISGYGGRTHTPVVDGDLVVISYLSSSWGEQIPGRHRYFAFDKRTGDVVWVSTPGGRPLDTTYSTPVVAKISGQRLLIAGNADGSVYAMKANTGEKVWGFRLSKRGINSSVVVDGTRVYASHSEENIDNTAMGRVVCIDATGTGDVTETHEVWRYDDHTVGYTSPIVHDGRLYVVDNSANMHALDAQTGELFWQFSLGTVGKGSPIWADGKIYATEVNGGFHILEPGKNECKSLDHKEIQTSAGRDAEIYGSPAVAYGRVYFTTEEGLYCLGDSDGAMLMTSVPSMPTEPAPIRASLASVVRVVPAEVQLQPGESVHFSLRVFDDKGRFLGEKPAAWSLQGLAGTLHENGRFTPSAMAGAQAGKVTGEYQSIQHTARVRVIPPLPWSEDFEDIEDGKNPTHWIGAGSKFVVQAKDGNKVLVKAPVRAGLNRSNVYLGLPTMKNYTIQANLMGAKNKRRRPDMGLIANRYTLDMMGNHQRLQVRTWASDLRMAKTIPFEWQPDVWYTMKLRVDVGDKKAVIRGKVWATSETEPEEWTITAEDPLPNHEGSPGLYGYSAAEIYYDNLQVVESEQ